MGHRVTYDDLVTMLEPVGLPVVPPGVAGVALPHIALEPTAISILPGLRVGWEDTNIVIRYPLNANDVSTFEDLNATTYTVLATLLGSKVTVADTIELLGEADAQYPAVKYVIDARFPGPHDICGTTPTPQE